MKHIKMKIYCIPGLGADRRVFAKLKLPDTYDVQFIEYIPPHKKETLQHYVLRVAKQIDVSTPFQLIGLSFGGIIATELSKIIHPLQTILVSSVSSQDEVPWYYKSGRYFPLHKIVSPEFIKNTNQLTYRFFNVIEEEDKALLKQIIADTDSLFLKWALDKVVTWNHEKRSNNLIHIHGDADRVLPMRYTKPDIIIKNGGHLMIYDKAEELSAIIAACLSKELIKPEN